MPSNNVVHLIDDDEDVRRAVSFLLTTAGFVPRVYDSALTFLKALNERQVGCIVSDVRMPGMDGLELQRQLNAKGVDMPVIIMTGHADINMAVAAMKLGAADFIEKPFSHEALLSAVRTAFDRLNKGDTTSSEVEQVRMRAKNLSLRERQVLDGIVAGLSNKSIAHNLSLSPRTIEVHRASVMGKMGARNLSDLVGMAIKAKLGSEKTGSSSD